MKRYIFRSVMAAMAGIFLLLSFVSCGRAGYQYNNLMSEEDRTEFSEIMASAGIPDLDFGRIQMDGTVESTVLNAWQGGGAAFGEGSVHLVSLWGVEDGVVFNYHAGLMFEEEEGVIFFEKTDPILPFQLSRFASIDEMKSYLSGREGVSDQNAIFIDDRSF